MSESNPARELTVEAGQVWIDPDTGLGWTVIDVDEDGYVTLSAVVERQVCTVDVPRMFRLDSPQIAYWRIVPGPGGGCEDIYSRKYTTRAEARKVQRLALIGEAYVVAGFSAGGKRVPDAA